MDFLNVFGFLNLYGLLIIIPMILTNVVYAKSNNYKSKLDAVDNRSLLYIERIGSMVACF